MEMIIMKKKVLYVCSIAMLAIILCFTFMACNTTAYLDDLDKSSVFSNSSENLFAQTQIANLVRSHMDSGTNKKALILAFDGVRADAMYNICKQNSAINKENMNNENSIYSGINLVREKGGLYMGYCGGIAKDSATKQATSTSPGFTSMLTGKWGNENGVIDNGYSMNAQTSTLLSEYAKKGKKVSFTARWDDHFSVVFKDEFAARDKNYYAVTKCDSELDSVNNLKQAINERDIVFGIIENPDGNGHGTGFTNSNYRYTKSVADSDRYAYELITQALARANEDWLIIITTDHGGIGRSHGGQSYEERTIWMATNKPFEI